MRYSVWSSILAAFLVAAAAPTFSQVRPSATRSSVPLIVGLGFSDYNVDFGLGTREQGGSVWADWTMNRVPSLMQGLGVEAIAHTISFNVPARLPNMRYDTAGGGIIYHFQRPRNVHPYAKLLYGFGSMDFPSHTTYTHDTRAFIAFGGGADIRAWRRVWVRADYEYQMWSGLFGRGHALTPNGFTIGPEFDFGTRGWH